MTNDWFFQVMGLVRGPVDSRTLRELAVDGEITRDTFVRRQDGDWITADRVKGLLQPRQPVDVSDRRLRRA